MTPETLSNRQFIVPTPDGRNATLVRTWRDDQIQEMISTACDIVEKIEPPEDLRLACFQCALNMVGQMAPKESQVVMAPPMSAIDNGKR